MSPAFSNASVRNFTAVFFDSAYKAKDAWDNMLLSSSNGEAVVDVQIWMNRISLDSIGIAAFSHDFGSLKGKHSEIAEIFDAFSSMPSARASDVLLYASKFLPILRRISNKRLGMSMKLGKIMGEIAKELLRRTEQEKQSTGDFTYSAGQSIIGALSKL